ncbi:MAG TPA: ROK family protein [Candidatus Caccomorpha excrementavium]|nr:ROK family protein [Candidatus Caccomorpha excrementavium]
MKIGVIDIGGTKTIVSIISEDGEILASEKFATEESDCFLHLAYSAGKLEDLCRTQELEIKELAGIGVNCNGLTDPVRGELVYAPAKGWRQIPVREYLYKKTGHDVIWVDNDVNACGLGEYYFGLGRDYRISLWVTVSTGIGSAIVLDGNVLRGSTQMAGELGHIKVACGPGSRSCSCGQTGCLEAYASGTAIANRVRELGAKEPEWLEEFRREGLQPDAYGCSMLAGRGDRKAAAIYEEAGRYLGRGLASAVNLLNPDGIIIGGGVAASFHLMENAVREEMRKNVMAAIPMPDVAVTALGYEAAVYGAAAGVLHYLEGNDKR